MKVQGRAILHAIDPRRMSRRQVAITVAVVVGIGAVFFSVWRWNETHPQGLDAAIRVLPAETQRVSFTDWSLVRRELRVPRGDEVTKMPQWLQETYDKNLAPVSNLVGFGVSGDTAGAGSYGPLLQEKLGFSPANTQWEAYGYAQSGNVEVVRLNDTVDFATIRSLLAKDGYAEPTAIDGVWEGSPSSVAGQLSEFANIVLIEAQHLVITSASPSALQATLDTIRNKQPALNSVASLTSMLKQVNAPISAMIWPRDSACADVAMSKTPEPEDRKAADQAIAAAGKITPLVGLAVYLSSGGVLTATEQFTSAEVAQGDLQARATLATGPEYNGTERNFSDDFTLEKAETKDATIVLRFRPRPDLFYPFSHLYADSRPLIFATC